MAYSKYTWQNGEVITADKLNHIEEGINNANGIPRMIIAGQEDLGVPLTWEITEGTFEEITTAISQKKDIDIKVYLYNGKEYIPYLVTYARFDNGSSFTLLSIYAVKISVGSSSPTPDMRLQIFYVDENNNLTWGS